MITFGIKLAYSKTERCGIIPYTINNGKIYFLMAVHSKTKELGDFGGGVKRNEYSLTGGFREFLEESNNLFDEEYSSSRDLLNKIALVDGDNMAIIFAPLEQKWFHEAGPKFRKLRTRRDEISDIMWIEKEIFIGLINNKHQKIGNYKKTKIFMWQKIRNFLKKFETSVINTLSFTLEQSLGA
jgi:hypothetical protein